MLLVNQGAGDPASLARALELVQRFEGSQQPAISTPSAGFS